MGSEVREVQLLAAEGHVRGESYGTVAEHCAARKAFWKSVAVERRRES